MKTTSSPAPASAAAALLGSAKSPAKAASSRANGRKGGRPKTIRIKARLIRGWHTTPHNQGQTVLVAYADAGEYLLERVYDRSDGSQKVTAYHWPAGRIHFNPWNEAPSRGRRAGRVELT